MRNLGSEYDQVQTRNRLIETIDQLEAEELPGLNCPVCKMPFGSKKTETHPDGRITHARARCANNYRAVIA